MHLALSLLALAALTVSVGCERAAALPRLADRTADCRDAARVLVKELTNDAAESRLGYRNHFNATTGRCYVSFSDERLDALWDVDEHRSVSQCLADRATGKMDCYGRPNKSSDYREVTLEEHLAVRTELLESK